MVAINLYHLYLYLSLDETLEKIKMKAQLKEFFGAPIAENDYKFIEFVLPCGKVDTIISIDGLGFGEIEATRGFIAQEKSISENLITVFKTTELRGGVRSAVPTA